MVFERFKVVLKTYIGDLNEKGNVTENTDLLPDGIFTVYEANQKKFKVKMSINDNPIF